MQPYQERVVQEFKDLNEKREKLSRFLADDLFKTLPDDEQERLLRQHQFMGQYESVLRERIEHFPS